MPALPVAAAFEDIGEADQVCIDVGIRIDGRMGDAGLRGKMQHVAEVLPGKQRGHRAAVREIALMEMERRAVLELGQPRLLQARVVIGVEVVEAMNGPTVGKEPARQMKANEAGSAGHKNGLVHPVVPGQPCSISPLTAAARFDAVATVNRAPASAAAFRRSGSAAASNVPPARPAASPVARSWTWSPMIHDRDRSRFMRFPAAAIMPGLGLRQG